MFFRLVVLVVTTVILVNSCDESTGNTEYYGSVSGTVVNKNDNSAVSGVHVYTEPPSESLITDDDGIFEMTDMEPGDYRIFVEKEDYYKNDIAISVRSGHNTKAIIPIIDYVTGNDEPEKPVLVQPKDNLTLGGEKILLRWNCNDPNDDKLTYDIYLDKQNPPARKIASQISETKYAVSDLDDSITYYWRVVAKDIYGASSDSKVNSFFYSEESNNESTFDDLVLYLPFNGNANDGSGNGVDGVAKNIDYVNDRNGNDNSAAFFSGNDSYIEIPYNENLNLKTLSLSVWIKPSSGYGHPIGPDIDLIGRWGNYQGKISSSYLLYFKTNGYLYFSVKSGPFATVHSSYKFNPGTWYHVAVVYSENVLRMYVDGVLNETVGSGMPESSAMPLSIGTRLDKSCYYNGMLDEIQIYNRALTTEEINALAGE